MVYGQGDCSEFGGCSGRGNCTNGLCQCLPGFTGRNCTEAVSCEYWDVARQRFSSDGCAVVEGASGYVTCNCTHLTTFAAFQIHDAPVQYALGPVEEGPIVDTASPVSPPDASISPIIIVTVVLALILQLGSLWLAVYRHRRRLASFGGKAWRERAGQRRARILERAHASRSGFASAVPGTTPRLQADGAAVAEAPIETGIPSATFNQSRLGQRLAAVVQSPDTAGAQPRQTRLPACIRTDAPALRAATPTLGSGFGRSPMRIAPKAGPKQSRLAAESLPPAVSGPRVAPDIVQERTAPLSLPDIERSAPAQQERMTPVRKLLPLGTGASASNAVMAFSARSSADHLFDAAGQPSRLGKPRANGTPAGIMHEGSSKLVDSPPPSPPGEARMGPPHTQPEWRAAPTPTLQLPEPESPWRYAPIPNERIMAPPRRPRKPPAGAAATPTHEGPSNHSHVSLPPPAAAHPPAQLQSMPVILQAGSGKGAAVAAGTAPFDDPAPPARRFQPSTPRTRVADSSMDGQPPTTVGQPGLRTRTAMLTARESKVSFVQAWWIILRTEHTVVSAAVPLQGAAAQAAYVLQDPQAIQVLWLQIHTAAAALAFTLATVKMSPAASVGEVSTHAAIVLGPCVIAAILCRLVFRLSSAVYNPAANAEVEATAATKGASEAASIAKRRRYALWTRMPWASFKVVLAWTLSLAFETVCIAATLIYTLPFSAAQSAEYFASVSAGLVLTWLVAEPMFALGLLAAYAGLRRMAAQQLPPAVT